MRELRKGRGAGCGMNTQELSGKSALVTSSSKMSGACSPAELRSSYRTWPRSGTMQNGKCSPQPPLVPRTIVKGCSLLPTPIVSGLTEARLLAPLERIMGEHQQSVRVSDWLGIRFDRARKASAREAYRGPVIHRVDDGSAERLDRPGGVGLLPRELVPIWTQRLKALGNGIAPQQSYAVAPAFWKLKSSP